MSLPVDLISQFVKATADTSKPKNETTVLGTIVYDGRPYVKLDGSDLLTPVTTTTDVQDGERVTVLIKDHTATVTGNISSPAARTDDVKHNASKIAEFEIIVAYKVTTEDLEATNAIIENLRAKVAQFTDMDVVNAEIDNLEAKFAELTYVKSEDIEAITATIESLEAKFGEFTDISTEDLEAIYADIGELKAYTADFTYVSADILHALKASVDELDTKKLSAEQADLMYADIDFSNIKEAAIRKIFSDTGIIKDLVVGEGTIIGKLVGVTITGDLIEANTIKADKLVVKGSDGFYYKLNFEGGTFAEGEAVPTDSLHGSVITAQSITAEKVSVDDLVAFDATIGGFKITESAIHSHAKESATSTVEGIYMDRTGQMAIGDGTNFLKYFRDEAGNFKMEISADSILLGASRTSVEQTIINATDEIRESITDNNQDVINACTDIITHAVEDCVNTGDYEEFKSTVESQLAILADSILMNFTTTEERLNNVDGDLQAKFTELYKYISFSGDGITIGGNESGITLTLDNDGIMFRKNGIAFGRWDGVDFYTGNIILELNERAQFGNFSFMPRPDGSLSFFMTAQTNLSTVEVIDNVLTIKNTSSIFNGTTAIIEDIPSSITNTTLTLEV